MILQALVFVITSFLQGTHQAMNYQQALQLSNITNINELFEKATVLVNGQRATLQQVFPYAGTSGDQIYISPGIMFAQADECSVRLTTVEVQPPNLNNRDVSNMLIWPKCTRIRRCGGCCANDMLSCVPTRTRRVAITLLVADIWDPSDPALVVDWEGPVQTIIEEHLECGIVCSITARDCNHKQQFDRNSCSCNCRNVTNCSPRHRWDIGTCECLCKEKVRCQTGHIFDNSSCSCHIDRNQQYANLDEIETSENANATGLPNTTSTEATTTTDTTTQTTTTTTATTTTAMPPTTTTASATTINPCATQYCPLNFVKVPQDDMCLCRPNMALFGGK